jgi:hypothetical protein
MHYHHTIILTRCITWGIYYRLSGRLRALELRLVCLLVYLPMAIFDPLTIANETYTLAASSEPIAPLVKEALGVIDDALNEYGCAALASDSLQYVRAILTAGLLAPTKSL